MHFVHPSTPTESASSSSSPAPPRAPKLTGTVPGLLDASQLERLLRSSGSTLSFVPYDPLTASSSGKHPQREGSGSGFRPKRIVIETTPSGQSTWRFIPSAQLEEGVTDEGEWPRLVDVCGIRFELSQEQWDIYKLDSNHYHCIIREPPQIPMIVPITAHRKKSTNVKTTSTPIDHHTSSQPSPITGDKRRVPSPAEHNDGATSTAPTSPIPIPPKKRPHIPTSAPIWVETESESEESEVEGMVVDDDEQPQSQSQSQPQSQSHARARNLKEKIRMTRRERQQRTARRTEWLSNREKVDHFPTWTPSIKEYSMLDDTSTSASSGPVPTPSPSIGKRKGPSTSDTTPRATNEAHHHAENGRFYDNDWESSRNGADYASTSSNGAKRARTVSPSSKKHSLRYYKEQRQKEKASWRRFQQEQRARAREAERLDELLRNNANFNDGYSANDQNHVNRCDTVEMLSVHSDIGQDEEEQRVHDHVNSQESSSSASANANPSTTSAPTTPTPTNPDQGNNEGAAERLARIAESQRKLAELEADKPLWERVAAERRARERREEEQKKAEQLRRRAETEKAEWERKKREEEARQRRSREEAARKYAEQEERARQQMYRERRQRDSTRHGPWTVERAKQRYIDLSERFDGTKFGKDPRKGEVPLRAYDIPWPILQREYELEDVTWQTVSEFFSAVRPTMKAMEFKKMIIKSHVRFHTDRWASRRLLESIVDDTERECIEIANKMVIQQLTPIWEEVCGKKTQD